MRSDFLNRQVSVRTELASQLPAVSGDRQRTVLLNLLVNGCDAMAGSEAQRNWWCEGVRPGRSVTVTIADRGTGIPPEELERIFEPFVTTKPQGLGMGLAVCRSIVKSHGGRLWASNNPGGGAVLRLELPAEGLRPISPEQAKGKI
jgi:C4-dicarboxylate-specific signal transduction histidine kinase